MYNIMTTQPRPFLLFFLILILQFGIETAVAASQKKGQLANDSQVYQDRIVIKFRNGPGSAANAGLKSNMASNLSMAALGVRNLEPAIKPADAGQFRKRSFHSLDRIFYANLDGTIAVAQVLERLAENPDIEYAEPLYKHELNIVPNDPMFDQQNYFSIVEMQSAWDVVRGSSGDVIVAIVDGGTDVDHPDLVANLWNNEDEIPGNGIDDDNNGFTDDVNGWNFATGSPDPTGLSATPSSAEHGTITAGLACAVTDNAIGIAGTSWNAKLMPLNAVDPSEDGVVKFGYEAIIYAARNGANVLNLSWGRSGPPSRFEQEIIEFAADSMGVAIVASAGNENAFRDNWPAAYPYVISVASTNPSDSKSTFSTFGNSIDISAPGEGMVSTRHNGQFGQLPFGTRGTSFSAPLVAGVIALVRTQHPEWSGIQAAEQVRTSAQNIDATLGPFAGLMGKGRLNARRAVTLALPSIRIASMEIIDSNRDGIMQQGETIELIIRLINYLEPASNIDFALTASSPSIIFVEGVASLSAMATMQEREISLLFDVDASAPSGQNVSFQLSMSGSGYSDRERFTLTINPPFRNLGANNLVASITNVGRLGFADSNSQTGGTGVAFNGSPNLLFEGALILGTSSTSLSNAARSSVGGQGFNHDNDFLPVGTDFRVSAPGSITDEESFTQFDDSRSNTPLGLEITQETFAESAQPDDDFIVFRFTVQNQNSAPVENFHFGLFFDWDIAFQQGGEGSNAANFSANEKLGFAHSGDIFVGAALMSEQGISFRAIDSGSAEFNIFDGFSDAEKWQAISGGLQTSAVENADVAIVIAAGPVTLPANESVEIGFALVAGESRVDIEANAQRAQQLWSGLIATSVDNGPTGTLPRSFALYQNFPNPFNPSTEIRYDVAEPTDVQLTIFNMLGQQVRTLVNVRQAAGSYSVVWDGASGSGLALASGTYLYSLRASNFFQSRKLVLIK